MLDGPAFEDPIGSGDWQVRVSREAFANVLIAFEVVFPAPAVETEALRAAALAAAQHDRSGVAQPDVAERLHDHLCERAQGARAFRGALVSGNEPNLLALAPGVHRLRERSDLALGRLQVAKPKLGIARKADPHGFVRRPFGEWRSEGWRHDGARRV